MTELRLPNSLPYPITIAQVYPSDTVSKHQKLFAYKYWEYHDIIDGTENPKKKRVDLVGIYESPLEGKLNLKVARGQELAGPTVVATVEEACAHEMQYAGMCVQCGKSIESTDYSGYDPSSRATLAVSHTNAQIRVSQAQARQIETERGQRLRSERKLILVVDLDQTVIHAGVDPTIGEWMKDESNPNHAALDDVSSFKLMEPQPVWYYIKVRPGTRQFLAQMKDKYEMHIYTMATRSYAEEVAKILDPDGTIFGERILSRDESGSMTHKSLERLFPVDQSMVVVIDDRADVWGWDERLLKVVPYSFFVGTGDINSGVLTRATSLLGPSRRRQVEEEEAEVRREVEEQVAHGKGNALEAMRDAAPLRDVHERVLFDEDDEVPYIQQALEKVHSMYYDEKIEDVAEILPRLKSASMDGVRMVFSGLIPLGAPLQRQEIVRWSTSFGAQTVADIDLDTTHVVAKAANTYKCRLAVGINAVRRKNNEPEIKIVHPDWIFACMTQFKLVSTEPFELKADGQVPETEVAKCIAAMEQKAQERARAEAKAVASVPPQQQTTLLQGDWLENDDEMDSFLSDSEDDEEDGIEERDYEAEERAEREAEKRKREEEQEETAKRHKAQEEAEVDDLEAELMLELGQ